MKKNELLEKFVSFLFDNKIVLKHFSSKKDLSPTRRKFLIKNFLNSKIKTKCEYCEEGYCTEIVYNTFNEPTRRRIQKRCIICDGTGEKTVDIGSVDDLL